MSPTRHLVPIFLSCCLLLPAAVVRVEGNGEPRMVPRRVVMPDNLAALERLAVEKLTATARSIFGIELPVVKASAATSLEGAVVIGTPVSNPLLRETPLDGLSHEGFLIRQVASPRGRFLALASPGSAG